MRSLVTTAIVYLLPITVYAAGLAEKGAVVFKKCAACHNINKAGNKIGPHLVDVVGRKTGSIDTYEYSASMKKAGADGIVWDEETLRDSLAAPKKVHTRKPYVVHRAEVRRRYWQPAAIPGRQIVSTPVA